jgi:hypothetical protein
LTKKAPYKGLGADSEEKRELASDIDTAAVDSLKVLDPERPIREANSRHISGKLPNQPFRASLAGSARLCPHSARKNAPITSDMQDTRPRERNLV